MSRLVSQKDETCDSDSSLTETIVQNFTSSQSVINPKAIGGDGTFPLGEEISMTVSECALSPPSHLVPRWIDRHARLECASPGLDVAGPSGKCSDTDFCSKRSLDFKNDQLKKDNTSSHPYLRLTGVAVSAD